MRYRVVHAPAVVVDEAETEKCPYCPRRGRCQSCLDSRRILLNDGLSWPVAVVEVTEDIARSGEPKNVGMGVSRPQAGLVPSVAARR